MRQRRAAPRRPRPTIRLRCFPPEDAAFRAAVREAAADVPGSDPVLIAERVRDRLAERYRLVVVRPQDPLAAPGENGDLLLYAFRDGTAVRPRGPILRAPTQSAYRS